MKGQASGERREPLEKGRPLWRFVILVLAALALQGIPFLYTLMDGDAGVALYLIHLYVLIPLMAALIPYWAGLGGVHPFAAFFPIGLMVLLLPVYEAPGVGVMCLVLSLVAAVAGQEARKRGEKQKGTHHGGSKKRL